MIRVSLFVGFMFFILAPTVEAYIDPGAGSMLLQVLLGGAAGLIVVVRLAWSRIIGIFRVTKDPSNVSVDDESHDN